MPNEIELAWLAGLLEGDGSFEMARNSPSTRIPRLRLAMLDEDVVKRVALFFESEVTTYLTPKGDKIMYRVTSAKRAVVEPLIKSLYKYLGKRRQMQVDKMLDYYKEKENSD